MSKPKKMLRNRAATAPAKAKAPAKKAPAKAKAPAKPRARVTKKKTTEAK